MWRGEGRPAGDGDDGDSDNDDGDVDGRCGSQEKWDLDGSSGGNESESRH